MTEKGQSMLPIEGLKDLLRGKKVVLVDDQTKKIVDFSCYKIRHQQNEAMAKVREYMDCFKVFGEK